MAGSRTRSLVQRLTVLVGLLMVAGAQVATAAQESTLESRMPMNIAGPIGIVVAAIGLLGLMAGFWRFHRKSVKARVEAAAQPPTVTAAR
ncbi:MAG: hypothetical protein ABW215_13770 [Kibdelosporangium sp.]